MLLCNKCHRDRGCVHFVGSYGRCEGCGKTAACVDCKVHHAKNPPVIDPKTGLPRLPAIFDRLPKLQYPDGDPSENEARGAHLLAAAGLKLQPRS